MRTRNTTSDNSNSNQSPEHPCGMCGKSVPQIEIDKEHYKSKCNVCLETLIIHSKQKCAGVLWEKSVQGQKSKSLPLPSIFNNQTSLNLYCYKCRVPCFLCTGKGMHNLSKLLYLFHK